MQSLQRAEATAMTRMTHIGWQWTSEWTDLDHLSVSRHNSISPPSQANLLPQTQPHPTTQNDWHGTHRFPVHKHALFSPCPAVHNLHTIALHCPRHMGTGRRGWHAVDWPSSRCQQETLQKLLHLMKSTSTPFLVRLQNQQWHAIRHQHLGRHFSALEAPACSMSL